MTKRLVVCCDGTWNKPDSENPTNIEKIARTVQTNAEQSGMQQLVYYISGVGAGGYEADKLLGGAFGFGLFHNVIACYRFLALNYEPDDEIFIFGFSRGAYTARSLAGMLSRIGLLTKDALIDEKLHDAVQLYQRRGQDTGNFGESVGEFRKDHCRIVDVHFLGVFDTVGALGVPGFATGEPEFHDVQLSERVKCARQALAIDETRMKFAPTFWELPKGSTASTEDPRVKQVWFEGAHSDVGGGYRETGLADTTLLWMVQQAHGSGLVFDVPLLSRYVHSGAVPICHNPLTRFYKVDNAVLGAEAAFGWHDDSEFSHKLRRMTHLRGLSIRIASSAVEHFTSGEYKAANVEAFSKATRKFDGIIEPVINLPEAEYDLSWLGRPPG